MNTPLSTELIQAVRELSGLRITEFDYEKLSVWVQKRSESLGLGGAGDYLQYLARSNDLAEDRRLLSDLLTTGETFFMRDPGQMELIKRVMLPEIILKKEASKKIRIWAPACATGEEIYSLIILLEQVLPNANGWDIDIVGSDINPSFIEQAKRATYKEWAFRGCNQRFKDAYFQKVDDGWRLIDRIRTRARFLVFDLVDGHLPDVKNFLMDVDFILCRNLFIYMNLTSISAITDKLSACLLEGGVLLTAHGELHAYRQSGLRVKIYPESLVYEKRNDLKADLEVTSPMIPVMEAQALNRVLPEAAKATKAIQATQVTKAALPSIEDLLSSAWKLADQGRIAEALAIYQQILTRDSMRAELHYLHAVISVERDDVLRAKEDLRKTLYLDPDFIPAYLGLITIQVQEGKNSMAAKSCQQALKSLDQKPEDLQMPGFGSITKSDLKQYLTNLQNSLTSPSN
ncbi:CheR family methyltransferase [Polynucleobacter sp. UK-Gri1-W3]|uniref:CheR family methyltransferase n=1 Tax=Polynucleobacter sp. UK-Gri1-W3 TaxID=1819737 RepID=UPI001C0BB5B8|nr:CheR family methyltransferase [Polynucleobacter sp. UK-Gri1-W3]MBU3538682.1 hypothetical protein [Polynucleobacter sp. UK-Gri1-W3]